MRYRDEKFNWTYQSDVRWPNDCIGPGSMTQWILEASDGFTDVGLLKISESVRAYAYLILSSQASARSSIVGNMASALTAQSAFLNNFENVVNRRVGIREDLKPPVQKYIFEILIDRAINLINFVFLHRLKFWPFFGVLQFIDELSHSQNY